MRLRPGVDVEALNARMKKMAEKYLPARDSWSYTAYVQPLRDTFRQQDDVRRMFTIMLTLGLSILFITALNYALISISSLSRRAKMVGVHKCSGASGEGIFGMFMLETLVGVWLARLPLSWLLAYQLNMGINGIYLANILSLVVRAMIGQARYASGKWLYKKV